MSGMTLACKHHCNASISSQAAIDSSSLTDPPGLNDAVTPWSVSVNAYLGMGRIRCCHKILWTPHALLASARHEKSVNTIRLTWPPYQFQPDLVTVPDLIWTSYKTSKQHKNTAFWLLALSNNLKALCGFIQYDQGLQPTITCQQFLPVSRLIDSS